MAAATTTRQEQLRNGRTEAARREDEPRDLATHLVEYAQENPTTCAAWCFLIGFVLGWRLKPW